MELWTSLISLVNNSSSFSQRQMMDRMRLLQYSESKVWMCEIWVIWRTDGVHAGVLSVEYEVYAGLAQMSEVIKQGRSSRKQEKILVMDIQNEECRLILQDVLLI